jgi:hypothetical protein
MAGETEFAIGATVSCSDGVCGEVRRMIVDPATDTVTHLVVGPKHRREAGRLVPIHLADTTAGGIRLRCTKAEFDSFDHAEEPDIAEEEYVGAVFGPRTRAPQPAQRRTVIQDVVPLGEIQVRPGDRVHAVDGEIGRVQGFFVGPGDGRVTHVLLQEGHLGGRKEVAIPVSAVAGLDLGIRLNITKQQVESLPPVD